MKQFCNTRIYRKCVIRKVSFFVDLLDSNTTNIVKDIFIIPTEHIHKK